MPSNPLLPAELTGRDLAIVQAVNRFRQLSSKHVYELIFTNTTRTPCDVALKRLVERGYLSRIERRIVGGTKGGSGQYVYQLGRRGYFMFRVGRYSPARTVNFHALAIVETYLALRRASIELVGVSTEPDCHVLVGGVELRPDMFIEATRSGQESFRLFIEVDMGTEGQKQLRGKLEAYWRAYNEADATDWPSFPPTLWVAVDAERARELTWIIGQMQEKAQALFRVTTLAEVEQLFG